MKAPAAPHTAPANTSTLRSPAATPQYTKVCHSCLTKFPHRGDQSCPKCGSLDIGLIPTAGEMLRASKTKRERRASQLLAHYATCERLGRYLGMKDPDGKKISLALLKAEQFAHTQAERYCNGLINERQFGYVETDTADLLKKALGKLPPGFFVNSDPRGYALKIDNENLEGQRLISTVELHKDWGGYGILSPEIDGN